MEKATDGESALFTSKDMSPAKPGLRMLEQDQPGEASGSPEADEAVARTAEGSTADSAEQSGV